jgi:muconolactone D-isomerase
MEFLVEFQLSVPEGTRTDELSKRRQAEASASAGLAQTGHLLRLWRVTPALGATGAALGLYRADSDSEMQAILRALPLYDWMRTTVTTLEPHPNDPDPGAASDPPMDEAQAGRGRTRMRVIAGEGLDA